ncbi:MAG: UDP-N-acetylglucosamine--N-acetylmuramyl-(pentapeptide) pyrophosphoryl-undecaprenol N-acetylglucosamine transferase [bacterium]|nr:UDP-N-acetylglucosamine--N-acetylmuramyl-(pentapeptide) pyrophosphoryl-undecaprenol N-acetylglucosamine transferase [bacterium]
MIKVRKKIKVLLTAGGTGGHIYPLLAVGDFLRDIGEGEIRLAYAGQVGSFRDEFENRYMSTYPILPSKVRRYFSFWNFLDVPVFFFSVLQALFWVFVVMPDVVFSKGGPGTLAVILAARFYRIPVVIHESDAIPSVTNRVSSRFAARVGVSFQDTLKEFPKEKVFFSGNPLREELMKDWVAQFSAKTYFKLRAEDPVVLVLGGSQGSLRINNFILDNLVSLLEKTQIIHQAGRRNFKDALKLTEITLRSSSDEFRKRYLLRDYLSVKDMKIALNAADVVVARAGSGLHELALFGKPAILIPLAESANDHQKANAYEYARTGAAVVIEEDNLKPHVVLSEIQKILDNPKKSEEMTMAAFSFAKKDAAEIVGKEVLGVVGIEL